MPSKNTKKKLKQAAKTVVKKDEVVSVEENEVIVAAADGVENATTEVKTEESAPAKVEETKAEQKQTENSKNAKKKDKKPNKVAKKSKEVFSELKKVTWPTFPQIVKKTATVLAVVLIFAVVLFGIDTLLNFLYQALIGNLKG